MNDADRLLHSFSEGKVEALKELVEATCNEGLQRLGGDEAALLRVYQDMLDHRDQVRQSTEYGDWLRLKNDGEGTTVGMALDADYAQKYRIEN